MRRAKVLDVQLQDQLYPHMKDLKPLPSIYFPDFIAANQAERCVIHRPACALLLLPPASALPWLADSPRLPTL